MAFLAVVSALFSLPCILPRSIHSGIKPFFVKTSSNASLILSIFFTSQKAFGFAINNTYKYALRNALVPRFSASSSIQSTLLPRKPVLNDFNHRFSCSDNFADSIICIGR
jgi:hypothetical protein